MTEGKSGWNSTSPRWRALRLPPVRIALFAAILIATTFALGSLLHALGFSRPHASEMTVAIGQLLIRALPAAVAYLILVRLVEHRAVVELALRRLVPDVLTGVVAGSALVSAMVAMLWAFRSYQVVGFDPNAPWLPTTLVIGLGAAISEEIAFRGVFFRILENWLGTWTALAASALLFGLAHAHNPASTPWSSISIAVEAGLLIGLVFHLTRSLWVCMGLHAAWNIVEGVVYGSPVSGMAIHGWLISTRPGPAWLSGGSFGLEASPAALVVSLVVSALLMGVIMRRRTIVPMRWGRAATPEQRLPATESS